MDGLCLLKITYSLFIRIIHDISKVLINFRYQVIKRIFLFSRLVDSLYLMCSDSCIVHLKNIVFKTSFKINKSIQSIWNYLILIIKFIRKKIFKCNRPLTLLFKKKMNISLCFDNTNFITDL